MFEPYLRSINIFCKLQNCLKRSLFQYNYILYLFLISRYITDNNIFVEETGINNHGENVVRGSYSYVAPDGNTFTVNYVADRNGYRAYGPHLPAQPYELSPYRRNIFYTSQNPFRYQSTSVKPTYISTVPTRSSSSNHSTVSPTTIRPNTVYITAPSKSFVNAPQIYQYPATTISPISSGDAIFSTTSVPFYSTTAKING